MNNNYEDIINLEHHISTRHLQMSLYERASQFAPFAALTGFEEAVSETARETTKKVELDDEEKSIINNTIIRIYKNLNKLPKIKVTYFIQDMKKQGGKYTTIYGKVQNIDEYKKEIILKEGNKIHISDIIELTIVEEN